MSATLNLMNERVMIASLAGETPGMPEDGRGGHPGPHLGDDDLRPHAVTCQTPMRTYVRVEHDGRPSASILHADLDSFYASVEQRDDPTLRGRPVIVGGGVVLAASYEAKAHGVRTAMGGRQALRLCPDAVVVPPRMSAYSQASDAVFEVFRDTTPLVEPLSVDEAFLDVSGLRRTAGDAGADRRPAARPGPRPGRPADHRRHRAHQVPGQGRQPGGQARRAAAGAAGPGTAVPAPAARAPAVGRRRQDRGEAARPRDRDRRRRSPNSASPRSASMVGGAMGRQLFCLSRNIDRRRVVTGVRRRSVGAQRALGRAGNTMSHNEIDAVVVNLVDRITRRMRTADRTGRTVTLRLRFDDFGRVTRSPHPAGGHRFHRTDPGRRTGAGRRRRTADRRARAHPGRVRGIQHRPRRRTAVGVAVRLRSPT